jgi:hypothetical protein
MRMKNNNLRPLPLSHKKIGHVLFSLVVLSALTLSACGGNADATPTISVDAIYTFAALTFTAQEATQKALTPPTPIPSATPFPTLPPPTLNTGLPFGSPTSSIGGGAQACDSGVYVADITIPDGTVMSPGKTFVKTWSMMNKGTCTWSSSYKLSFLDGEAMGGSSVLLPSSVPPGQQVQISVNLKAPANSGTYTGGWQLQNTQGHNFGDRITVLIKVSAGTNETPVAETDTPEPTATTP